MMDYRIKIMTINGKEYCHPQVKKDKWTPWATIVRTTSYDYHTELSHNTDEFSVTASQAKQICKSYKDDNEEPVITTRYKEIQW
jgi:hypothetical protein